MKTIEELAAIQEKLDQRIITDKNIQWTEKDRLLTTLVALDVELAEMANESQWFKVWKSDPQPKEKVLEEYVDALHFFLSIANQKGWVSYLRIHPEAIEDLEDEGFDGGLNGIYLEIKGSLINALFTKEKPLPENSMFFKDVKTYNALSFKSAWFLFMAIGLVGFKFTEDQIFEAYLEKNKVNHQRQDSGY
ncbi:dUTPase [Enterococcus plantarum]|uniref:dUTPase n=1 Tax=Enterococcus plantarum TaxID=1077675 RepID=A0A2W4BW40_9ENTE|nr:dUTP diphosphatase [Enterococcus plantarum]PZL78212.1 dUTPase [Enterococcus plantarum]